MKHIYMIGGTMGVGKTTVCQQLKQQLPNCVFLDGDWCWDMDPFVVNAETKAMVMENIAFLLNQYIHCSVYDNIVFCWVLHEQEIWNDLLSRLYTENCSLHCLSLICSEEALRQRLQKDIDAGIRQPDILTRSLSRLQLYPALQTALIDTSSRSPAEIAAEIAENAICCLKYEMNS